MKILMFVWAAGLVGFATYKAIYQGGAWFWVWIVTCLLLIVVCSVGAKVYRR